MKNVITTSQHKQKAGVLLKYFSHSIKAGKVFISKIVILIKRTFLGSMHFQPNSIPEMML